jgi:hypothetical protein
VERPISAIVLAAKVKNERCEERLCCMEASLHLPQRLGGRFTYKIERCIPFPPQNADLEADVLYGQALAVFIKTLRIGLTNAKALQDNKDKNEFATSLCCSPPREGLRIISSPIPHARPTELKISQGELFAFDGVDGSVEEWIKKLWKDGMEEIKDEEDEDEEEKDEEEEEDEKKEYRGVLLFDGSFAAGDDCIVKISCISVHKYLVSAQDSWAALTRIKEEGTARLRSEISKVLLARTYVSTSCLVTVTKNLGVSNEPLEWAAFSKLARSVLLPMAKVGVVHTDIRFDPAKGRFGNLMVDQKDQSRELRLIDFESLVILGGIDGEQITQDYAISVPSLIGMSAYTFVHWQVLWVAYVLCPHTPLVTTGVFTSDYSTSMQGGFAQFNQWIGSEIQEIPALLNTVRSRKVVESTLGVFDRRFSSGE